MSKGKVNDIPAHLRLRRIDEEAIVAKLRWINRWGPLMLVGSIQCTFYVAMALGGFSVTPGVVGVSVFVGVALLCLARRSQIAIHVKNRTYRQQGGLWPLLRVRQGRLAEFDRVELALVAESDVGLGLRSALTRGFSVRQSYYVLRLRGPERALALEARSWGFETQLDLADAIGQELSLPVDDQVQPEQP